MATQRLQWQEPTAYDEKTPTVLAWEVAVEVVETNGFTGYRQRVREELRTRYPDVFADLTTSMLDNHIQRERWTERLRIYAPEARFHEQVQAVSEKHKVKILESQIRAAAKEKALHDRLLDCFEEAIPRLPAAPPLYDRTSTDQVAETIVYMVSDLHAFEEVSAERTRGHNQYTPDIMCLRMGRMVAAQRSILGALSSGDWQFPHGVVCLLGDNISGTIHELERHAHGYNVVLAVTGAAWCLAQYIRETARHHGSLYVVGVSGNHGRIETGGVRRKQMKDPTRTWDYMLYMMLPWMLQDQPNIQFWFPDAWAAQIQIEGWEFLVNHGDDIKSWAGIPWYGIERRTNRILALEGARDNRIDYQLFGHFHTPASLTNPAGESFINGCVIGGNEFALDALAAAGPPKQWMLQVHEEIGVSGRWNLRLDIDRADVPVFNATPWLEFQRRVDQLGIVPKLTVGDVKA